MKRVIGIDISKKFVDVVLYDGQTQTHRKYLDNSKEVVKTIIKDLGLLKGKVHVVMEATGVYHEIIAYQFHQFGFDVSVVNPLIITRYGQLELSRPKTDKADASLIAVYGYENNPPLSHPPSPKQEEIRQLLGAIEDLQSTKREYLNRLESLERRAIPVDTLIEHWKQLVNELNMHIIQLEAQLGTLVIQYAPKTQAALLEIKGVGPRLSSAIIGYFGSFEHFDNVKQVAAFVGINPSIHESGTSVKRKAVINRRGHSSMRRLLYLASLSALKYNPACKTLYDRLREKGKPPKVAIIAVGHKLLRQIFAIAKYQRRYNPLLNT